MAYLSVMRKRIQLHKELMIRSYVVTFAFVTFRWLNELTIVKNLMAEFEERDFITFWFCWTIPLHISEIVFSWKKK